MLLTIFTPTYNRAHTIRRLFNSLCNQKNKDFEWLIIDDGSTDNTKDLIEKLKLHSPFNIRYYHQSNGGKHRAYNHAIELAQGKFFFVVDSDDLLPDNSIDIITNRLHNIQNKTCGLVGLIEDNSGNTLGPLMPNIEFTDCLTCIMNGERSIVLRTQIARRYPFPEIKGENFVTESVVYDRIGKDYEFIIVNEPLTIREYLSDGLSNSIHQLMIDNPIGFLIYHYQRINKSKSLANALSHTLRYNAFNSMSGYNSEWSNYRGNYRWLVKLLSPLGIIGRLYYNCICKRN